MSGSNERGRFSCLSCLYCLLSSVSLAINDPSSPHLVAHLSPSLLQFFLLFFWIRCSVSFRVSSMRRFDPQSLQRTPRTGKTHKGDGSCREMTSKTSLERFTGHIAL